MGITVVFAGLMLICLTDDGTSCPIAADKMNTAWVVKAHDEYETDYNMPCGWPSAGDNRTTLYVRFAVADFDYHNTNVTEKYDAITKKVIGEYELPPGNYCIVTDQKPYSDNNIHRSVRDLPRLTEFDKRYVTLNQGTLHDTTYVPSQIRFQPTDIEAGPTWPLRFDTTKPSVRWFPSNGTVRPTSPRPLSDQLKASYKYATYVQVTYCTYNTVVLELTSKGALEAEVSIVNEAYALAAKPRGAGYRDLPYLLWYSRLGDWETRARKCPEFDIDAYLLRCKGAMCNFYMNEAKDTTFWPVMRP